MSAFQSGGSQLGLHIRIIWGGDLPGGTVVKILPSSAAGGCSIPCQEAKMLHT